MSALPPAMSGAPTTGALLDEESLSRLAGAKILLARVPGFLYLPVFVPDEIVAEQVQRHLTQDLQAKPLIVDWPPVERDAPQAEPSAAQWAHALRALLTPFDYTIAGALPGNTLLVDASHADRHGLAYWFAPFLNVRREALRQRDLRLILLWPIEATLRQRLTDDAPDLWSMRSASPMIERILKVDGVGEASQTVRP